MYCAVLDAAFEDVPGQPRKRVERGPGRGKIPQRCGIGQYGISGDLHPLLSRVEVPSEFDLDQIDERAAVLLQIPLGLDQLAPSANVMGRSGCEVGSNRVSPLFLG